MLSQLVQIIYPIVTARRQLYVKPFCMTFCCSSDELAFHVRISRLTDVGLAQFVHQGALGVMGEMDLAQIDQR